MSSSAAGDVAQERLISMARSVRDFRGDASVSSWLYTIARRFCIKKRRLSKFAPTREESLDAPATDVAEHRADPRPNPEQTATNRELATALTHAIDALDSFQREVLGAARRRRVIGAGSGHNPGHERRCREEPAAPGESRHA